MMMVMSEHKNKLILAIILASIAVILLGGVSLTFFPTQQKPASSAQTPTLPGPVGGIPQGAPVIIEVPVSSTVQLDSAEGFNSSIVAAGASNSTLFVLPPGGTGSIPFLVSTTYTNETVNASLAVDLWSPPNAYESVQFNVSPSNITISPGEQAKEVLTITADENAPSAFYMPYVDVQSNSSTILETQINMPDLLVANSTPSCFFLVNDQQIIQPNMAAPAPESPPIGNASAGIVPTIASPPLSSSTPIPSLSVVPTINMVPGETSTILYGCLTQNNLSLNVTAPAGFSTQFSPNPLTVILGSTSGKMYALTIIAGTNIGSGTYKVNATGSLSTYQFDASFSVVVK